MTSKYTFTAVIPAYNPGLPIISVISEAIKYVDFVFLIDDGCNEENKRYIHECSKYQNVKLISWHRNRGKGHALFEGFRESLKHKTDYIITLDSDGQHNPKEITKFIQHINESEYPPDLLIGTRKEIASMPLKSKIGNIFTVKLFHYIFGRNISDTQSGFRAHSAAFLRDILQNISPGKYETEMKILTRGVKANWKIDSIIIETIYLNRNINTKFRPLIDSCRVLMPLAKYTAVAISSFCIDYTLFLILSYIFGVYYLSSHIISRIVSSTFNYFTNKKLVFKSRNKTLPEYAKYLIVLFISFLITSLLLYIFVDVIGISKAIAKPIAEITMFFINFLMLNKFVFKNQE